jgi:nicotinate-nucleotide adenylyltransferase
MKTGILGGTFNPPHIGHIVLAEEVLEKLSLDRIFFVPTNLPPHKNGTFIIPEHRIKMLSLAVADNEKFEVIDYEIDRGGVSYTIDTISDLKKTYPDEEFFLIIGSDLARDFSSWHQYEKILSSVKVVVAGRDNYPFDQDYGFLRAQISQIDISSSQIRQLIKQGQPVKHLVNPVVLRYLDENKLYV